MNLVYGSGSIKSRLSFETKWTPWETRNVDIGSQERSDSVHSQVSSHGSKTIASPTCDTSSSPEKSSASKRKKEKGDTGGGEYRIPKYQKSAPLVDDDDEKKKKVRQIRNRESAQLSRLRKKQYVEELQVKFKSMSSAIAELNGKISYVMAENAALRHQMAAAGAPPYMAAPPLPYQWMPYSCYPVRGGNGGMLPHSSKTLFSGSPEGKRLHQWFHEGGSGTLMDYSMCTEVFQFDIAPGAIVPSSVSDVTREHVENVTTTHDKRMKNRRILERLPVSLVASELNITEPQPSKDAQNKSFHGEAKNTKPTSSSSSMVISVLLDPMEVVDSETDRVMPSNPKSLSRIFVVVLLDSVKYVTYSCVLPRSGLHLVAT
ncbi:hypothetical protein Bca4012_085487 [Brassica carinata]